MQKILIVDDEIEHLEAIMDIIEDLGAPYRILQAFNGKSAYQIAVKENPDLIITDWEMPEMTGIELIKQLKSNETTMDIPIIMCTGIMTTSENLATSLDAGAVDYVRKPVDKTELSARIHSMLKLSESYKEIKRLNATKDKFFSIIAHDLKSPFSSLLGFSNLLLDNYDYYDDTERKTYIKHINDGSIKFFKLVENLLAWAQSQSGGIDFKPERINIEALIKDVILLFAENAVNKNIELLSNIEKGLFVNADKNMIDTVIRNLVSNAIKFTPKAGTVSIKSRTIVDENNRSLVEISVKDNGVGISPEIQNKLFNITENVSTKGTEKETGTGLGLILCKEFIEKHNGEIGFESEVENLSIGKESGTTFWFKLALTD